MPSKRWVLACEDCRVNKVILADKARMAATAFEAFSEDIKHKGHVVTMAEAKVARIAVAGQLGTALDYDQRLMQVMEKRAAGGRN